MNDWQKELCNSSSPFEIAKKIGQSLIEMAKERGFECNTDLKIRYKYLKQTEKERKLTDAEKADKRNIEILKKW